MNNQLTSQQIWNTIGHYDSYYKVKRSERQRYIMNTAIKNFIEFNDLENPNEYLLYLIADKSLSIIKYKSESDIISQLEEELQKDISLFKKQLNLKI